MFTLIEPSKKLFSERKHQIDEINKYLKNINKLYKQAPDEALFFASKLLNFYNRLETKGTIVDKVKIWAKENPPDQIRDHIACLVSKKKQSEQIETLSNAAQLPTIYAHYSGKKSFAPLIQKQLDTLNKKFEVQSLPSGNNPIVLVKSENSNFIIRLLRMNQNEEAQHNSPRIIRDQLDNVQELPSAYLVVPVENDGLEVTYLEYSEYYKNGNLQQFFSALRSQKEEGLITADDFEQSLFNYAKKMTQFFSAINEKHIWFTDLKPTNILLDDNKEIVMSDIKGLVSSPEPTVHSSRTSTSPSYYDSAVFDKNQIKLELLQRQTLATTLYQLACGKLPQQCPITNNSGKASATANESNQYENIYDFKQRVFETENGLFLKNLINRLNSHVPMSLDSVLIQLDEQLGAEDNISLEDDKSMELSTTPNQDGYYRMS